MKKYKVAILDDYQNTALDSADWSSLRDRADIAVFQDHLADPDAVIERLLPFDVICVMRERTPLPRRVIEKLPNLKLIASTGPVNASGTFTAPRSSAKRGDISAISSASQCRRRPRGNSMTKC